MDRDDDIENVPDEVLVWMNGLTSSEAFAAVVDIVLGKDWYCVDPLGPAQVNAMALREIKRRLNSPLVRAAIWATRMLRKAF